MLTGDKIKAEADFKVENKVYRKSIFLEIISNFPIKNYDTFWEKSKFFDLRDNKFEHLLKTANKGKVFIVGIAVKKKMFFIYEIHPYLIKGQDFEVTSKVSNFGNKKGTTIYLPDIEKMMKDLSQLCNTIKNIFI